ncbi:MAG: glycosyltransferase family 39 protein [Steroidobacteraceae bacterium]
MTVQDVSIMQNAPSPSLRGWPLLVLLILLPLWAGGIAGRNFWTPDEPREADIAWQMSQQADRAVPQLAQRAFLEKPPLSYWLSALSIQALGTSAFTTRLPNFLYALISTLAVGWLACSMAGKRAALVAALAFGSSFLVYRTLIWLAPDAALLAGVSVALLGAWRGVNAPAGRAKLGWYSLMHLGSAVGFMAKSAPGWLVPALALVCYLAWERRWRELLRYELYAGLALQAAIIGPWVWALAASAQGADSLRAFLWYNTVGRFMAVDAPAGLQYTQGHRNHFGKYFIELGIYALPWTLLLLASLRRAFTQTREANERRSAWRFAVAVTLPWLILLSFAATARDIYAAPAFVGAAVLIALWYRDQRAMPSSSLWPARGTLYIVGFIVCLFSILLLLLGAADAMADEEYGALLSASVAVLAGGLYWLYRAQQSLDQAQLGRSLALLFAVYGVTLVVGGNLLIERLNPWYDLPQLAKRIDQDVKGHPFALLQPDETTIAMLDFNQATPSQLLEGPADAALAQAERWFADRGPQALLLVKLPGRAQGEVTRLLGEADIALGQPDDGLANTLVSARVARIAQRYEIPHGRRYALLAPPAP